MATEIDQLEVKISSDSSSAAAGIDALAVSLGNLKKNGTVNVAVKNLNNLSDALRRFTSIQSPSHKIQALTSSLQALKGVGSVAPVARNIGKLGEAMNTIKGLDLGGMDSKFEAIANAASKLSGVKSGGLGTMVNALAKIGKVTESLDDETIAKFANRVSELNKKLEPLSTKMTTIQAGLRGVNSAAKTAGRGVKQMGDKLNSTSINLSSFIYLAQQVIHVLAGVARKLAEFIDEASQWDGISARFGRGFGAQAQETYDWIQRLNKEMGINTQQFMQYSSTYATMLSGFGVASKDASTMALGYMELTYDIWAGYNDIYKSLDDAATAVRSAIAGEVEPVRKAGFTIIESTLAQTAANHGLEISLENATEAQKSYLRYLTLVDQAYAQNLVGTYAKEMNTAEGLMRTFNQQLKSLAQSFGSLFIPVLVKVMPYIQAFIALLTEAVHWLAGLFGIKIQRVDFSGYSAGVGGIADSAEDATEALEDTAGAVGGTTKALKELKNATLGIDELNIISPPDPPSGGGRGGSGGVGGGGGFEGLDVGSLWDEAIFDNIQSKVDELRRKVKEWFEEWKTEIGIIGAALGVLSLAKLLGHLGKALELGNGFLGVMKTISKLAVTSIIITLQYSLMAEFFKSYIDGEGFKEYIKALIVGAIGTGILYSMWGPTGLVIGLAVTAAASLKAIIENGGIDSAESATVALTGLASAAGAIAIAVKKLGPILANSNLGAFFALLKEGNGFLPTLAAAFPKLSGVISSAASAAGTFLAGISAPVWAGIAAAIAAVVSVVIFLKNHWDEVTAAVKRFFQENIVPKLQEIKDHFTKLCEALSPIIDVFAWIIDQVKQLIQGFKDWWDATQPIQVLGEIFETIGGIIFAAVSGTIMGAIQTFIGAVENVIQVVTGIVQIVRGVIDLIVALLSGGDIGAAWQKIWDGVVNVVSGLWGLIVDPISNFVGGIIDWFVDLWDELVGHSIVPDTIQGIVDCFLGLPGKVLGSVGKFVGNVIDKFKDFGSNVVEKISSGWDKVKSWFSGKKSDVETTEVGVSLIKNGWTSVKDWIGNIPLISQAVGLAKKGWSTVKGWIGSIPGVSQAVSLAKKGWSSIKNWVGSIPTVSQAVGLVKKGWSSVKGWIGSVPTLSAGIKLVKKGWSSIKNWLGNLNFNLGFKLPKIGVKWGTKEVLGFKISYPNGFYTYAKGGFPDMGEMFIAREAGPEMVGKIGSKTTVANNDQIVDAVSEGVYAAVLAAMKANSENGSQSVNVYLDGRQITSAVEQRQRERGASIMGKQVYAY